ncbi:TonB-dependent receptor domain-containing protein, partial [Sphingobium sp.]|uniref:TonB-dependent receptor domain-containing protein n=1 Tax=Sphingobium sp. TaxID=1912891 RepID=UPI002C1B7F03
IVRNGNDAPTPVTVLGREELNRNAQANVADALNQLPQFAGSTTTRAGTNLVSRGTIGANFLNLRYFGSTRTLVLLDGRRVVPANVNGSVDVNVLPSALISRVDVVTGGASAAYGSDAVTGVVNFILDTKFTGLKGEIQGGVTQRGDDEQWKVELTGGTPFADGRGHILASASYSDQSGIARANSRRWYNQYSLVNNPAYVAGNGEPQQIAAANVNFANAAPGGLIINGPAAGTTFGSDGTPRPFQYGTVALGRGYMIGGESTNTGGFTVPLDTPLKMANLFARASYEISDDIELFGEFTHGYAKAEQLSVTAFRLGNLTMSADNAFLPASVRSVLSAGGARTFGFGTTNTDLGQIEVLNSRKLWRYMAGAKGDLGDGWKWDAYYQFGKTESINRLDNLLITANYAKAIDARRVNGAILCAVNADASTANDDPSCVPYNIFGSNVGTAAGRDYISGTAYLRSLIKQQVAAATITGEPFDLWAGPVSIATGLEYRKESVTGEADAISLAGGFFAGNFRPTFGSYDVTEGFLEVAAPLLRDSPLGRSLELSGAVRRTHYSVSGNVTTWKAGLTYQPVPDLVLRLTRSRDIRAPNLNDLFLGGRTGSNQSVRDPQFGNATTTGVTFLTVGNTNLTPEIADTLVLGAVYRPSFAPGFSISADYYDISITDTISTISGQDIVDRCFAGNQALCPLITRDPATNMISQIQTSGVNLAKEAGRGLDVEISYRKDLADISSGLDGILSARVIGGFVFSHYTDDGVTRDTQLGDYKASNGLPIGLAKRRVVVNLGYEKSGFEANVTARNISSGKYDPDFSAVDIDDNHISGVTYFDLGLSYKFDLGAKRMQVYLKIDNALDKDPVPVPAGGSQPFVLLGTNPALFDTLGRTFRAGLRFTL